MEKIKNNLFEKCEGDVDGYMCRLVLFLGENDFFFYLVFLFFIKKKGILRNFFLVGVYMICDGGFCSK